jgi:uncharacterized membrane protein YagU involved in acid resistance
LSLPMSEQNSEFFGHAVWGFSIEIFRVVFRARFSGVNSDNFKVQTNTDSADRKVIV